MDIIKEISLLYELSLSVGQSIDLKENCDRFLQTLMARKNLDFSSVWIKNSSLPEKGNVEGVSLVYANPEAKVSEKSLPLNHPMFRVIKNKPAISIHHTHKDYMGLISEQKTEKGTFLIFALGEIGILKLFSSIKTEAFETIEINKLINIISKFTTSINGCLFHQEAIFEADERIRQENQHKILFDNNSFPMFIYETQSLAILDVNETLLDKYEYSYYEMHKKSALDFIPVKSLPHLLVSAQENSRKISKSREGVHKLRNGNLIQVEIIGRIISYKDTEACLVSINDITEKKKAQKRIRESEKKYRSIFEAMTDAYAEIHIESGEILEITPSIQQISGYRREELIGTDMQPFYAFPHERELLYQILRKQGKVNDFEVRLLNKNKEIIHCSFSVKILPDAQGQPEKIVGTMRDISERKQMEETLEIERNLFDKIIESITDPIFFKTTSHKYLRCNKAYAELYGKTQDEIIGKSDFELYSKAEAAKFAQSDTQILESKKPVYNQEWIEQKNGKKIFLSTIKLPSFDEYNEVSGIVGICRNITDIKLSETALLEAENKWRSLLDNSPDTILALDKNHKIIFVNKTDPNRKPETIIGQSVYNFISKAQHKTYKTTLNQAFESGDLITFENNVLNKWYISRFIPLKHNGKTDTVMIIATDISERKKSETQQKALNLQLENANTSLKSNEQYLKNINKFASAILQKNTIDEILWEVMRVVIKELKFIDCIIYLFAKEMGHLVQKAAYGPKNPSGNIIKDPITISLGKGIVGTVARTGKPERIADTRKDKRYILDDAHRLSELCVPIISNGEVIGVIDSEHPDKNFFSKNDQETLETISGLISTRLKNAVNQEKLETARKSLIKLSTAVEQNPVAVIITDTDGKIEYINSAFTQISGYTFDDVFDKSPNILFSGMNKSRLYVDLWKTIKSGKIWSKELINKKKNGQLFHVLQTVSPIKDDRGETTHFISMQQDITRLKQLEEDLIKAKERAESASEAKGQFLSTMSHEIRTPMNAVNGLIKLLQDTKLDLEQKNLFEKLNSSTENLLNVINDVLDFSKIESGLLKLENKSFDFHKQIRRIIDSFEYRAEEKSDNLSFTIEKNIPTILKGDPTRLHQILMNLVSNAIKFTENGMVKIHCKYINKIEKKHQIEINVIDTGIGISPENLSNIFESFKQEDDSTTRKYGGTGLGLAICKQLVELMGSKLEVKSTKGMGSDFYFRLLLEEGKLCDIEPDKKPQIDHKVLKGIKILYAEDNSFNQFIGSSIMQKWNAEIDIAENGKIAIEKIKNKNYDIILMDLQMPVMGGIEACKIIRQELKLKIPIIALSANVVKGTIQKCLDAGMNDYIPKPFEPDFLYKKLVDNLKLKVNPVGSIKSIEQNTTKDPSTEKHYDLKNLEKLLGNDKAQIKLMIKKFTDITPAYMQDLNKYFIGGDNAKLSKMAHKIKSSLNLVASQKQRNHIQLIEEYALKEEKTGQLKQLLDELNHDFGIMIQQLKNIL
jgi:PAS domain S-box-containing protein